jgi:hypothetical protein
VILYLSFEELTALSAEAERARDAFGQGRGIVAPPQLHAEVENFAQLLTGDVSVTSLEQQESMRRVLDVLLQRARTRMDSSILEEHAAAESAVAAYFDYAHMLSASQRLDVIGAEMHAMLQLMAGRELDSEAARRFSFPD